jgi:hypothetical protein
LSRGPLRVGSRHGNIWGRLRLEASPSVIRLTNRGAGRNLATAAAAETGKAMAAYLELLSQSRRAGTGAVLFLHTVRTPSLLAAAAEAIS